MALPEQIDYAAPVPPMAALPANRADWSLDRDRAAVLVHDMQEYFLRPYAPHCAALKTAREAITTVLDAARAGGVPVFYTAQRGNQDQQKRGLQRELWGPGMAADPSHTEIVADLAPAEDDVVLVKHRYSAFYHSDLAEQLAAAGRDQLVIVGVYAHIGVTATALDAFQQEIHPFVIADGVADFGLPEHTRALEQVASSCGVVLLAGQVIDVLITPAETPPDTAAEADSLEGDWAGVLADALARAVPPEVAAAATAAPEADMFELGLNSLQAFEMLDDLADAGVDIDFGDFVRNPTLSFIRTYSGDSADRG